MSSDGLIEEMKSSNRYTPAMLEMFEGFWSWPFSQKVFGVTYLVILIGLFVALGLDLYIAS